MSAIDDIRADVDRGRSLTPARARVLLAELNRLTIQHLRDESRLSHYGNEAMKAAARAVSLEVAAQAVIDRYQDGGWPALQDAVYALQQAIDAKRDPIPLADMVAAVGCYRIAVQYGASELAIAEAQAALFAANRAVYGETKKGP